MNIGFEAKRVAQNAAGLGNYARTLIGNLARFAPESRYFLYSPVPFDPALAEINQLPQVALRGPATKPNLLVQHWLRYYGVRTTLRADRIDLYHGLSGVLPRRLGCPAVVTIHDLIYLRHPEFYGAFDRWTYHRANRRAAENAEIIFAVSHATKEDICTFLGVPAEKIIVTYQSCRPEFDRERISEADRERVRAAHGLPARFVLNLGTLEPRKNAANLVRGFALAAGRLPEHHLVLVGRQTRYGATVRRLVGEAGLSARVHFLDFVPGADLPALYSLAELFAYPSLSEGFGIPVLEAMRCGTPALTSNRSSLREVGGEEASLLVDPLEPEAIGEGLAAILTDRAHYERLQANLPAQAAKFSAEAVTARVLAAYRSLLR